MMVPNVLQMILFINHSLISLSKVSQELDIREKVIGCLRLLVYEHRNASIFINGDVHGSHEQRPSEERALLDQVDRQIERATKSARLSIERSLATFNDVIDMHELTESFELVVGLMQGHEKGDYMSQNDFLRKFEFGANS